MHLASKKLILRLDGSCPSRPEAQWLTDAAEPRLSQLMPRSGASWRWAIQCHRSSQYLNSPPRSGGTDCFS